MEFKAPEVFNRAETLFSSQYSDPADLFSQHLTGKLDRLLEQVEYIRDNPDKASSVAKVVKAEMKNHKVFAQYSFGIVDGSVLASNLMKEKIIQNAND